MTTHGTRPSEVPTQQSRENGESRGSNKIFAFHETSRKCLPGKLLLKSQNVGSQID